MSGAAGGRAVGARAGGGLSGGGGRRGSFAPGRWGLVGRRTGEAPGPRARPPGPGRGTGWRGPSSASRPGPAARPGGLRGLGRRGDSARGRGEGVPRPRRPDPGPGPARFFRRGRLRKAGLLGRPCPWARSVRAPRGGRCSGCAGHRPAREAFRARDRRLRSARVWDACFQLLGRPGAATWRPAGPGVHRGPGGSPGPTAREAAPAPPLTSPGAPGQVSDRASVSPEGTRPGGVRRGPMR